eukprot:838931_1
MMLQICRNLPSTAAQSNVTMYRYCDFVFLQSERYELQHNRYYNPHTPLQFVPHVNISNSLGGAISQIVASQLYRAQQSKQLQLKSSVGSDDLEIKSFSLSAPGLVWNSRKFSIDVGDLYKTSTVVNPNHDIMTRIDRSGGLTQNIECHQEWAFECHLVFNSIAELSDNCEVDQSLLVDIGIVCRILQHLVANHTDFNLQMEQM